MPAHWSWRERHLAVVAALVVALWGIVGYAALPLRARLHTLRERTGVEERKLTRLHELLRRQTAIARTYETYADFRSEQPPATLQRDFLDALETLTQQGHVQINLKPRPVECATDVVRVGVEVDVEATQEALLAFLDQLFAQPAAIELDRLRVTITGVTEAPLRANLVLQKTLMRSWHAAHAPSSATRSPSTTRPAERLAENSS